MARTEKLVIRQGQAKMVYSDRFACIARALGDIKIDRASNVEFSAQRDRWEATLCTTGQVIATGPNRAAVIDQEVKFLEREV